MYSDGRFEWYPDLVSDQLLLNGLLSIAEIGFIHLDLLEDHALWFKRHNIYEHVDDPLYTSFDWEKLKVNMKARRDRQQPRHSCAYHKFCNSMGGGPHFGLRHSIHLHIETIANSPQCHSSLGQPLFSSKFVQIENPGPWLIISLDVKKTRSFLSGRCICAFPLDIRYTSQPQLQVREERIALANFYS